MNLLVMYRYVITASLLRKSQFGSQKTRNHSVQNHMVSLLEELRKPGNDSREKR